MEMEVLGPGLTTSQWQDQDLNPGHLASELPYTQSSM